LSACLSAVLLIALADSGPASAGSRGYDSRRASDSYRAGSRLHIQRDHHRGRGFTERRSRLRNPSYIRRDDRRRALSGFNAERPSRHSESSTTLGGMPFDASGITHVSPGSRRVVRFYDE
jgi:hypothetical protein